MEIEAGNAGKLDTNNSGWFVGFSDYLKTEQSRLRLMSQDQRARTICIKWMDHPKGDPRGGTKPPSEGRTISILISDKGGFRLQFATSEDFDPAKDEYEEYTLAEHGDFVIWGEGVYHRWLVDEPSTILTVRWIPVASD